MSHLDKINGPDQHPLTPSKLVQGKNRPVHKSKQGQKPPIKAKQKSIQRRSKTKSLNKIPESDNRLVNQQEIQHISQTMGHQYGVDNSGLNFEIDSSFPRKVDAAATLQSNQAKFAKNQHTQRNVKHEIAHYMINAQKKGTPGTNTQVNGWPINTTDESQADHIAQTPLQQVISGEQAPMISPTHHSNVVQRTITFKDASGKTYKDPLETQSLAEFLELKPSTLTSLGSAKLENLKTILNNRLTSNHPYKATSKQTLFEELVAMVESKASSESKQTQETNKSRGAPQVNRPGKIVPNTLNIIGETHEQSNKHRDLERKFSLQHLGLPKDQASTKSYWTESEFKQGAVYGDNPKLRFLHAISMLEDLAAMGENASEEKLGRMINEGSRQKLSEQIDSTALLALNELSRIAKKDKKMAESIRAHTQTFNEAATKMSYLIKNKKVGGIVPGRFSLGAFYSDKTKDLMQEFRKLRATLKSMKTVYEQRLQTLDSRALSLERSRFMHQFANRHHNTTAVWKVGNNHVLDMQGEEFAGEAKYNLVTKKEFRSQIRKSDMGKELSSDSEIEEVLDLDDFITEDSKANEAPKKTQDDSNVEVITLEDFISEPNSPKKKK